MFKVLRYTLISCNGTYLSKYLTRLASPLDNGFVKIIYQLQVYRLVQFFLFVLLFILMFIYKYVYAVYFLLSE